MLISLLNPIKLVKAFIYHKKKSKYVKSSNDLELHFYSKILKNDMLHFGYFDDPDIDPESISISQVEDAQIKYAEKIIEEIEQKDRPVLDVGCGMGGLSGLLLHDGFIVESLTPNNNQIKYIQT